MDKATFERIVHDKVGCHPGEEIMPDGDGFKYIRWNQRQTGINLIISYRLYNLTTRWVVYVYEDAEPTKLEWGPTIEEALKKAGL